MSTMFRFKGSLVAALAVLLCTPATAERPGGPRSPNVDIGTRGPAPVPVDINTTMSHTSSTTSVIIGDMNANPGSINIPKPAPVAVGTPQVPNPQVAITDMRTGIDQVPQGKAREELGAAIHRAEQFSVSTKIENQMPRRGWDHSSIQDTISNPYRTEQTLDNRYLNNGDRMNDPATAYIRKDEHYVVKNDINNDIVQISDRNDPDWLSPFNGGRNE